MIMVGDRGMITGTRIDDLRKLDGMGWITALKAPAIAKLAEDGGPLQLSLFDTHNFAQITHPDYPGERLICCHNPVLAADRARTRGELLAATEAELAKVRRAVAAGRLQDPDKIGIRAGKVINKHKVGKHFILDIGPGHFSYRRDQAKIAAEAALDGIYVIRTSVRQDILDAAGAVTAYKNLKHVERDFRITKADDLDLRPIHHYLADRVRGHVLICMLACYLTWHLRAALAELTFTDQHIPAPADPVTPAQRSDQAKAKDAAKHTPGGLPVTSYQDLLAHLATLTRQVIIFAARSSSSPDSASRGSPPPPPSRPKPSSCSAPQSHSPSSSHSTRPSRPRRSGITPGQRPAPSQRSSKFGLSFTITRGKIVAIEILADPGAPDRLARVRPEHVRGDSQPLGRHRHRRGDLAGSRPSRRTGRGMLVVIRTAPGVECSAIVSRLVVIFRSAGSPGVPAATSHRATADAMSLEYQAGGQCRWGSYRGRRMKR